MKKRAILVLIGLGLASCGEDQTTEQRNATPSQNEATPPTQTDRDPTPQTSTGGASQVEGSGTTSK
ncbi:MAG: hypothetical protein ACK4PN_12145 [Allorhizobium sp.]